jgi:hypothetical protein
MIEGIPTKCRGCGNEYVPRHAKDYRCADCYAKLGRRSKRKGNANELRFSKYLNEQFKMYGIPYVAQRTPRSGGIQEFESADIMFRRVPSSSIFNKIHFENKNCAVWDIRGWMEDAVRKEKDTGKSRKPALVIRRPSEHEEYVVTRMEDFVEILISLDAFIANE